MSIKVGLSCFDKMQIFIYNSNMDSFLEEQYRKGLRQLLTEKGSVVEISEREKKLNPDWPTFWVSTYGWKNWDASNHIRKVSAETAEK